ncbi:hypothetical protein [Haloferula rosea]|uniref:Uncharacterized protein n=1 Tax=Haloferula rosea TaxID=490093 RepID=A0A934VFG8_9BACT|nr:hypothetical protein [Haloferula rosea]MBK1828349.1 hypothetical protein [Haloferula rosea]
MKGSLVATLGVAIVGVGGWACGENISWFSDPGRVNLTSHGTAMGTDFDFELGVFSAGFEPTAFNRGSWLNHWTAAQSTSYSAVDSRFVALHSVAGNLPPFVVGAEAWIFGRRDGPTGTEWILFRHPSWTWPAPNPLSPFPLEWNASAATIVMAGDLDADGMPHLMKSEEVQDFSQWRVLALSGEPLNGSDDDPDRDGVENVIEFLAGTDPQNANSLPGAQPSIIGNGGGFLQVDYSLRLDRLAAWTVEVGSDLVGWESGDDEVEVTAGGAGVLARDLTPRSGASRRFMRLRVLLP